MNKLVNHLLDLYNLRVQRDIKKLGREYIFPVINKCIHVYIYVCMYVCTYVRMYVFTILMSFLLIYLPKYESGTSEAVFQLFFADYACTGDPSVDYVSLEDN